MSNSSQYIVSVTGTRREVARVARHLEMKRSRYKKFEAAVRDDSSGRGYQALLDEAMEKAKVTRLGDFATWGYQRINEERLSDGRARLVLMMTANENGRNLWVSDYDGELHCLQDRFPSVTVYADYKDDYGSGNCVAPDFEKSCSGDPTREDAKVFCITGSLSRSRAYFEECIKRTGHLFRSGFSSKVTHLVTAKPEGRSSKLKKARENGTEVISEAQLMALLGDVTELPIGMDYGGGWRNYRDLLY